MPTSYPTPSSSSLERSTAVTDQVFWRQVGLWMLAGLGLTTTMAAWLISQPEALSWFFTVNGTHQGLAMLGWVAMLAPLVLIFGLGFLARSASLPVVAGVFLLVAACFGVTLAPIGLLYTSQSLLTTLAATTGAFAGFAAWGFLTKKNLAGIGHFAFMGLIGLIVLGFIQIFWPSNTLNFLLGAGGVVVFTLLTAWDVQRIKQQAAAGDTREAVWGALSLYLDFINLFIALLRLMGGRK